MIKMFVFIENWFIELRIYLLCVYDLVLYCYIYVIVKDICEVVSILNFIVFVDC